MRLYTLASYNFFCMDVNGHDFLPMPEWMSEVITRKGLDHAVRTFGAMPGQTFQLRAKTFFLNDAAMETALAAYRSAAASFTALQATRQRDSGSYFNYDTEGVRYVLISTENTKAVSVTSQRICNVVSGGGTFAGCKTSADFTFNLLPVIYVP